MRGGRGRSARARRLRYAPPMDDSGTSPANGTPPEDEPRPSEASASPRPAPESEGHDPAPTPLESDEGASAGTSPPAATEPVTREPHEEPPPPLGPPEEDERAATSAEGAGAADEPAEAEPAPAEAAASSPEGEAPVPPEDGSAPEATSAEAAAQAAEKSRAAEEHERSSRENAERLEREIEALSAGHQEGGRRQFRAFFEHERQLHALFKDLKPLHAADRHRLWGVFKQIGAEARRQQQEEWESRRYQSIEARETIEEKIRTAESLTQGAPGVSEYRKADSLLNEVRALLASSALNSPGQVLIGPDRRACWDRWRAVRDTLRQRRGGLQERDYQTLAALVVEVVESASRDDPFRAVQRVKELQAQLGKAYLRRGQFEELRRRLSEAWQAAQARITEQRQERTKRRAEWRERMEGHLSRWRDTLEHRQSQREHLLQQLAKLEGMEKNARSEDFAAQVRGWKDETSDKLRRVDEFIADLQERITSASKKLGGRGPREPSGSGRESTAPPEDAAEPEGEEGGPEP